MVKGGDVWDNREISIGDKCKFVHADKPSNHNASEMKDEDDLEIAWHLTSLAILILTKVFIPGNSSYRGTVGESSPRPSLMRFLFLRSNS